MRSLTPLVALALLSAPACKQDPGDDTTPGTETTAVTPDDTTSTTDTPTSSTTDEPTSTTGAPSTSCVTYTKQSDCIADAACKWGNVFTYSHGMTGCQGDVRELCVAKTSDTPSTWYRPGGANDFEVIGFDYQPDDLPDEWKQCDCDGPLACLCGFPAPDCPDRLGDFCGKITETASCNGATVNGDLRCGRFRVYPEGPLDDTCTAQAFKDLCLPADNAGSTECTKVTYPYDVCSVSIPPAYWRVVNGTIEVTTICGPAPAGDEWTLCDAADTPEQPDECGCACGVAF